ncbi:hypothetical protein BH23GEM10_BH23GEM10_17050 [soil metagenome]
MRHTAFLTAVAALVCGACASTPADRPPVDVVPVDTVPPPPPANASLLPANTHIRVTLARPVGPGLTRVGDTFTAEVVTTLHAQNGAILLEEGTVITAMVTGVEPADEPGDLAAIRMNFLRMNRNGVLHPLTADIVRTEFEEASNADRASAAYGFVVSGELLSTLVSESFGRGAGTVISLGRGETEAVLPAGTQMTIRTIDPLDLRM